jgi:hypothetical protein
MGIISELMSRCLFEKCNLAEEEPERIEPGKEHPRDNLSHALFSESQIVATDYRRVDEEHPANANILDPSKRVAKSKPCGISSIPVKNQVGVWIIF